MGAYLTVEDINKTMKELTRTPTKEDRERAYKQTKELMQYWADYYMISLDEIRGQRR